ncbi:MAG: hypothetical protein ABW321_13870 [Polyangiales bacterium]
MTFVKTVGRDQRGLILIPAIAMVSVLALGTLHITDTALAEMARIFAQTRADAEALEGAIWHAQGMNLLVTLNIIMAVILALFVAIRLVVLGLVLVTALAVIGSFLFPGFAGVAAALARGLDAMHRVEERVAGPILNTLKTISNVERVVAATVPWVAAALPVSRLSLGDGTAVVLSVSMFPDFEQVLKDLGRKHAVIPPHVRLIGGLNPRLQFPARLGNFSTNDQGRVGHSNKPPREPYTPGRHGIDTRGLFRRFIDRARVVARNAGNRGAGAADHWLVQGLDFISGSLPAQDEDYYQVCSRAAELTAALVTKVLLGPLNLDQGSIEAFNTGFGQVIGSFQSVTCKPLDELSNDIVNEIESNVGAKCEQAKRDYENPPAPPGGGPAPAGRRWTHGLQQKCEKDERKKANEVAGTNTRPDPATGAGANNVDYTKDRASTEEIKTAALWGLSLEPKQSPLLHVWSVTLVPSISFAPADSEAEFRHTCDGGTDAGGRGCGENSLWRYGWFAKTVQLKPFWREFGAYFGDMLQGWLNRAIGKAVQGIVGRLVQNIPAQPSLTSNALLTPLRSQGRHTAHGRHRSPDATTVRDVLFRHLGGVRAPDAGNAYWSRRWINGEIGKYIPLENLDANLDDGIILH